MQKSVFIVDKMRVLDSALHTISVGKEGMLALENMLKSDLAESFVAAVHLIAESRGRVIVTGLGKSGHIGSKIAATLASTGTPAFFVHAGEANHGDLGMITRDDIILALSWSGETVELKGIVNYSRRFHIPLIALTSGVRSSLGCQADIILLLPKADEACPHGLAPTTSTLIQLALGDALAIALLETQHFSVCDFKMYHPGGSLGASLRFVKDIMHTGDALPLVQVGTSILEAMRVLVNGHFGCVAIVDRIGKLEGILTDGDIARNIMQDLSCISVDSVMTRSPKTVPPDMITGAAISLINKYRINTLLITEDDKLVGIVSFHDLLGLGIF
ncbi:MAG: arabinose-5-phosphate isomerase [Candidatus Tokpelaia sp. JSC161]|jgi:arabinose-5-phosphate isomerase|nr:MAG: arabinose-5-phosphate isomerase [Candidatus Tokpelaia sp. JSC161]